MLIALWGKNTYDLENILLILSCHGEKAYIKMVKQFENAGLIMTFQQLWHKVYICSKIKHRIQCKTKYIKTIKNPQQTQQKTTSCIKDNI